MSELFKGVDGTLWVFWGLSIVAAAVAGGMLTLMALSSVALWRRRRRERKASFVERVEAVSAAVAAPGYGRVPAVDPEPTVPIPDGYAHAGLELPPRAGLVFPDTLSMLDGEPLTPEVAPRPEDLADLAVHEAMQPYVVRATAAVVAPSRPDADAGLAPVPQAVPPLETDPDVLRDINYDDEYDSDDPFDVHPATDNPVEQPEAVTERAERPRDDEPPAGGPPLAATAVMPRYRPDTAVEPWPAGRAVLPEGPTSPSSPWMLRLAATAVRVWHLGSPLERRLYRLRILLAKAWAYQCRYATTGRHEAVRLCRRSWLEIAEERQDIAGQMRSVVRRTVPSFPMGCVPL